jgi:F-type H+-transporting ATPase subunit b
MDQILNILGSVGFNWHVALANFVNFLIILFLLNKFFFGKIGKAIETRHDIIERGLHQASEAEKALALADEHKNTIIRDAKKEGHDIILRAEGEAKLSADGIVKSAEDEAHKRLRVMEEKELSLKETVEKAFGEKAPELIAQLYAKTLLKEMNQTENDALIARMKV